MIKYLWRETLICIWQANSDQGVSHQNTSGCIEKKDAETAKDVFNEFSKKGQNMNHPFKTRLHYGKALMEQGWLEATCLNSTQQHREGALSFTRSQFPWESEEKQVTIVAGIMHYWSSYKNWKH